VAILFLQFNVASYSIFGINLGGGSAGGNTNRLRILLKARHVYIAGGTSGD
jgi:hypothetical protein